MHCIGTSDHILCWQPNLCLNGFTTQRFSLYWILYPGFLNAVCCQLSCCPCPMILYRGISSCVLSHPRYGRYRIDVHHKVNRCVTGHFNRPSMRKHGCTRDGSFYWFGSPFVYLWKSSLCHVKTGFLKSSAGSFLYSNDPKYRTLFSIGRNCQIVS